jgi:transposase
LSTKIHATVDARGYPTGFLLTPGQACDRDGADALLPAIEAPVVIADKGYDADERVLDRLAQAGKTQYRSVKCIKIQGDVSLCISSFSDPYNSATYKTESESSLNRNA